MFYTHLITAFFLLLVFPVHADTVCKNPAYMMKPDSDILRLHQAFNSRKVSQRLFTEVHYIVPGDPNLTVGFGHWTGSNLAKLFQKLSRDPITWNELINTWAGSMDSKMWLVFEEDSGISGRNINAISKGLKKLLCTEDASSICVKKVLLPWSHVTKDRFNNQNHWFNAGWRSVSILSSVAKHQIHHWADSVVTKGQTEAENRNLVTKGGIASVISAVSSGLGGTMYKSSTKIAKASFKGVEFSWSLDLVPESVRPEGSVANEQNLLNDWRSLVAWQFYNVKKKRVRARMIAIWELFYEPTWGKLPRNPKISDVTKLRQHSGCYMSQGHFNTDSSMQIPIPLDCTAPVPIANSTSCVIKP